MIIFWILRIRYFKNNDYSLIKMYILKYLIIVTMTFVPMTKYYFKSKTKTKVRNWIFFIPLTFYNFLIKH
jgi:hypothetical protein